MKRTVIAAAGLLVFTALLAGCDQRAAPVASRNVQPSWEAAAGPFVVPGWKSGDKASWQEQITKRAQNQNEYLRAN